MTTTEPHQVPLARALPTLAPGLERAPNPRLHKPASHTPPSTLGAGSGGGRPRESQPSRGEKLPLTASSRTTFSSKTQRSTPFWTTKKGRVEIRLRRLHARSSSTMRMRQRREHQGRSAQRKGGKDIRPYRRAISKIARHTPIT